MNIRLIFTVLLTALLLPMLKAQQTGWFLIEQQEDRFGNFSFQSVFIQDQQIRIENAESIYILNLTTNEITLVFPAQKLYWTGSSDTLKYAVTERLKQEIAEILARMPEHARAEADSSFKKDLELLETGASLLEPPNTPKIVKNNTSDTILGYAVDAYSVSMDSLLLENIWICTELNPYAHINKQQLREMTRMFNPPSRVAAHRESTNFRQLTDSALLMRSVIPTPVGESKTEITQIKNIVVPQDFFSPPPDYKSALIEEVLAITMNQEAPKSASAIENSKPPISGNPFEKPKTTLPPR